MRTIGTQAKGIRLPIIRKGDDLVEIVARSLVESSRIEGYSLNDRDVVGVTEAVVARAQGNYATIDQIASDISAKYPEKKIREKYHKIRRNKIKIIKKEISKQEKKI